MQPTGRGQRLVVKRHRLVKLALPGGIHRKCAEDQKLVQ